MGKKSVGTFVAQEISRGAPLGMIDPMLRAWYVYTKLGDIFVASVGRSSSTMG